MDWIFSIIPSISLPTANKFYTFGWAASLIGAAITFAGVIFLMWGTRVRDHDFDDNIARLHDRAASSEERAGALEKETARLTSGNLELATNLERERTARARIEAGLASRHVTAEQKTALINALKGVKLEMVISRYDVPETTAYANEIAAALVEAGQSVIEGSVIMAGGGNLPGVLVEETADARLIGALIAAQLVTQKLPPNRNIMFRTGEGLNSLLIGNKPTSF
jgi:hypothetical protein